MPPLPWLQSHGPIEALLVDRLAGTLPAFRGCKATAPLKHDDLHHGVALEALDLPWLQSHGPIEAQGQQLVLPGALAFRGCKATAPLKLIHDEVAAAGHLTFRGCKATAPLKRCAIRHYHAGRLPFRGCKATAPLKQVGDSTGTESLLNLPWLQSHGPIEAITMDSARRLVAAFRGCKATAPLKLVHSLRGDRVRLPSVAAKPRPH